MAANTILLKGNLGDRHEEYRATPATIKPGHLLELDSSGKVILHANTAGKSVPRIVAKEDALQGLTVDGTYAANDLVPCHIAHGGDKLQLRVPAAAPAIVIGDSLISNGAGCVIKGVGSATVTVVGHAAEAVDNSAGGTSVLLAVLIV